LSSFFDSNFQNNPNPSIDVRLLFPNTVTVREHLLNSRGYSVEYIEHGHKRRFSECEEAQFMPECSMAAQQSLQMSGDFFVFFGGLSVPPKRVVRLRVNISGEPRKKASESKMTYDTPVAVRQT
jgi:hypothetical protein